MEWENTDLELMHKEHVKVCEAQKQTCVYEWLGINNFAYLVVIRKENLCLEIRIHLLSISYYYIEDI